MTPETYLIVKDDKILKVVRTDSGLKGCEATAKYYGIEGAEYRKVPDNPEWRSGCHIDEFDNKGNLHPIEKRIIEGYRPVPKGKKVKSGKLVDKTLKEQIDSGEIKLNDYEKYDSTKKEIRAKTQDELLSDGLITQEQIDAQKAEEEIQAEIRAMAIERIEAKKAGVK